MIARRWIIWPTWPSGARSLSARLIRPPSGPDWASLDLLILTPITAETERLLPRAEMPRLRAEMNDALLELVYRDPLQAWGDVPVIELSGPLDARPGEVLAALAAAQGFAPP